MEVDFGRSRDSRYSLKPTQAGVTSLVKVVSSVQVTVSLPLCRNSSSHDTVSSVPVFTGNPVSVLRLFQAGSNPVHCATSDGTRDTCVVFANIISTSKYIVLGNLGPRLDLGHGRGKFLSEVQRSPLIVYQLASLSLKYWDMDCLGIAYMLHSY